MIRPPPRSTRVRSSAASDVYKRQGHTGQAAQHQQSRHDGGRQQDEAGHVLAPPGVEVPTARQKNITGHDRQDANRDVHPEHRSPPVGIHQHPTKGGSQGQAQRLGGPLKPERGPHPGPGTLSTTSATLLACNNAAPTAWKLRPATSQPRLGARAHAAEASENRPNPYRYNSLRPRESAHRPTGTNSTARTTRYESDTHCTLPSPVLNSACSLSLIHI